MIISRTHRRCARPDWKVRRRWAPKCLANVFARPSGARVMCAGVNIAVAPRWVLGATEMRRQNEDTVLSWVERLEGRKGRKKEGGEEECRRKCISSHMSLINMEKWGRKLRTGFHMHDFLHSKMFIFQFINPWQELQKHFPALFSIWKVVFSFTFFDVFQNIQMKKFKCLQSRQVYFTGFRSLGIQPLKQLLSRNCWHHRRLETDHRAFLYPSAVQLVFLSYADKSSSSPSLETPHKGCE